MAEMTAGFVGLGNQGGPIAMRIAMSPFELGLWARRPEVLAPYVEQGAFATHDLAELGRRCEVIGVCVFGDADVMEVSSKLLPGMSLGSVLLIHSTVHPDTIASVAELGAAHEVEVLDAPVSGGGAAAAEGRLTVMVGGSDKALEKARPVIATYAGLIAHLGPLGAGAKAKLINNATMAANLATAHEAMCLGNDFGLDRAALIELISRSSGSSFAYNLYAGRGGLEDFTHTVDLLTKDVDLLQALAGSDARAAAALGDHARGFFSQVRNATRER